MWRHIERDNFVLPIELVKLWRYVAAVAVKDKQPVSPYYTSLYMSVEVLYLLKAKLISRPAVIANSNNPAR